MATNVHAHDLRWHTNALTLIAMDATGQDDATQPGSNVLFERLAPQRVFQNRSCISSGHDDGLCFDIDLDNVAGREFAESAYNPSITCLNANTNGTVVRDMHAVATSQIADEAGYSALSEGQTEIQLDAVGLSLSNSGMHLYVKADTDEKKKLLADTYVQLTAKPMKDKVCRNLNLRKLLATSDEVGSEDCYHKANRKSSQNNTTFREEVSRYEKPAVKVSGTIDQSMEQSSLLNHGSQALGTCTQAGRGHTYCKETYAPVNTTLSAREETNRQNSRMKTMPPLNKFHSQGMVINNNKDYPRDLTYQNKRHDYQRIHSHTFDTPKRQNVEEIGESHQEKRSKYTDSQVYRKKKQLILLHNQNYSSNNDDYIAYRTGSENRRHGTKMKMMTSPVLCEREDSNHGTCVRHNELTCDAACIQTVTEPIDIQSTCLSPTTKVSPMLFPNSTHLNSAAYDGVSMSNFIDYANNIRKNIKEDYKNLSNLIKEFSDDVQERNNNHSLESASENHKKDRKTSSENCVLM